GLTALRRTALAGPLTLRQPVLGALTGAGALLRRARPARLVGPAVLGLLAAGGGDAVALRTLLAGTPCARTALLGTGLPGTTGLLAALGQAAGAALLRALPARGALRQTALLVRRRLVGTGLAGAARPAALRRRVLAQRLADLTGRQAAAPPTR
ncbi:hypothetical protein, partial [Kitasatospora putterlickiae]|uniref:hypothetical protein n=1 Tax=Kitasatospora putterlickiae TaxID=221725 RepID=UPI003CD0818F